MVIPDGQEQMEEPSQPPPDEHPPDKHPPDVQLTGPKAKTNMRIAWLSVIVVLGASIAAAAVAMAGGSHSASDLGRQHPGVKSQGTTAGGSAAASPASVEPVSAARVAASGGALPLPTNGREAVVGWMTGRGGKELTVVTQEFGNVLQAGAVRQYSQMRYGCIQLTASVAAAQSGPSIPDASMQGMYSEALSKLAKGASDCRQAISESPDGDESILTHQNTQLLDRSKSDLAAGADDIYKATEEIQIAARRR